MLARNLLFVAVALELLALAACGSGSTSSAIQPTADGSSGSSPADMGTGACITRDSTDGGLFGCVDYVPDAGSVLAQIAQSCTTMPSPGFTNAWERTCPPGAVNGCQYPADAFGATGPTVVWYYGSEGMCLSRATALAGDASPSQDAEGEAQ